MLTEKKLDHVDDAENNTALASASSNKHTHMQSFHSTTHKHDYNNVTKLPLPFHILL